MRPLDNFNLGDGILKIHNVIRFPIHKKNTPPQNEEELQAAVEDERGRFVTEAAVEIAFDVFRHMERTGCDINSNHSSRHDLILISESIKSAMYRTLGMKHPLQTFAVNVVDESNSDTDFAMPLADE